ncbi:biotin/lipoyl-binding protein [Ohtaekwangia sp.]|uniref:biotin/lipoyl-binding protein n=1 Tax=Ohtaekwangia sp. TaxID=2066019 RepID=UPI003FA5C5D8
MLSYSGTIVADNRVALSFQVPGQITKVYVEEGQHVASDQLLAEATLEQVKDNFSRLKALHESGKSHFFSGP